MPPKGIRWLKAANETLYPPTEPEMVEPTAHYYLHEAVVESFLYELLGGENARRFFFALLGVIGTAGLTLVSADFKTFVLDPAEWRGVFLAVFWGSIGLLFPAVYVSFWSKRASGKPRVLVKELGKRGLMYQATGPTRGSRAPAGSKAETLGENTGPEFIQPEALDEGAQ